MLIRLTQKTRLALILMSLASVMTPASAQVDNRQMVTTEVKRGDSLNVREGPGTQYKDFGDIKRNQAVPVLGYDATGRWAKVLWQGREAWVAARFLSGGVGGKNLNPNVTTSGETYAPGLGPHVVAGVPANDPIGGLALRAGPGTSFGVTQVIGNNVDVFVVSRSGDGNWAFIRFMNGTGYVSTAFLKSAAGQGQANSQPTQNNSFESGQNVGAGASFNSVSAPDGKALPAVFQVSGVQSDDVLNIRRKPTAAADIISSYAPNQAVMVLEYLDNGWVKVAVGERVGFVNGKFLRRGGGVQTQSGMQLGLTCIGTEPFWSLDINADQTVRYSSPLAGAEQNLSLTLVSPSPVTNTYPFNFATTSYSGVLSQQICSDGMSDSQYGWGVSLIKQNTSGAWETLNGCCSLQ